MTAGGEHANSSHMEPWRRLKLRSQTWGGQCWTRHAEHGMLNTPSACRPQFFSVYTIHLISFNCRKKLLPLFSASFGPVHLCPRESGLQHWRVLFIHSLSVGLFTYWTVCVCVHVCECVCVCISPQIRVTGEASAESLPDIKASWLLATLSASGKWHWSCNRNSRRTHFSFPDWARQEA